jgi:hypothetical protein
MRRRSIVFAEGEKRVAPRRWAPLLFPLFIYLFSFFFPGRLRGGPHGVNHPCQAVDPDERSPENHRPYSLALAFSLSLSLSRARALSRALFNSCMLALTRLPR